MSLESWREEFYPTLATAFEDGSSVIDAVKHSLTKWRGLSPENMARHGVYLKTYKNGGSSSRLISEDLEGLDDSDFSWREKIQIDSSSCSLCQVYDEECSKCVFTTKLGQRCGKQFDHWFATKDAQPMVTALENICKILTEAAP